MKKQVVAILIALVVISSLLTASVLSEEAYKPIIQSVTVSPTEIVDGGLVTFTVIAKSNAPVVCYKESTPGGTRCMLGTCTNVGDDLWECEWTRAFSEWAPAASYTYSPIYVINEGELRSDEWPHSISFNVTRSDHTPTPVPTPTPVTPTPPEEEGFGGYNVSLCDAIAISIGNATVTDFLNATNITTVQLSNFKGYKGENTWRVQWSFSNRSLDVYINVATGNIVGIEEKTGLSPTPVDTEAPSVTNMVVSPTPADAGARIIVTVNVTDDISGVRRVSGILTKEGCDLITVFMLDPEGDGIYTGTWYTNPVTDVGIYNLDIVAMDNRNNEAVVRAPSIEIIPTPVDTEAPSVTNMVVSPTPAYSGTPIELSAEVTDALSGVRDVRAIISKGCKEVATVFMLDPEDEGIYTGIWHTMVFTDGGIYNIDIIATNIEGNVASVKAPDVELVIDQEGPPSLS